MTDETMRRALEWAMDEIDALSNKARGFAYPQGMTMLEREDQLPEYENAVAVRQALTATQDHARSCEAGRDAAAKCIEETPSASYQTFNDRGDLVGRNVREPSRSEFITAIRALPPPAGSGGVTRRADHISDPNMPDDLRKIAARIEDGEDPDEIKGVERLWLYRAERDKGAFNAAHERFFAELKQPTPSPDERAKLAVIQGIATELATELDSLFERFLSAPGASKEDDLRQFLWSNKVGFLRIAQSLTALRTTPAPAVSEEEVARLMFKNAIGMAQWDNEFYAEERAGCLACAKEIVDLFNPSPSPEG